MITFQKGIVIVSPPSNADDARATKICMFSRYVLKRRLVVALCRRLVFSGRLSRINTGISRSLISISKI